MAILTEIILILLLILANGAFALSEIAVVSARKARLQNRADEGSSGAKAALHLANDPGRFLATVQIGITLVGILAGTFGGATLSKHLANAISQIPPIAPAASFLSVAIVVLAITYLSLIIGELVPKRVGLANPEGIAAAVAKPMRILSRLSRPAVWFLEKSSDFVLRLVGYRPEPMMPVTEEEIKVLVQQGREAGVFEKAEEQMVKGVFRLADRTVLAIMTPRTQIDWLNINDPTALHQERINSSPRSRFPVARDSLDNVVGIAEAKRMLGACISGSTVNLESVLERPVFVPDSMSALGVLDKFKTAATHTALVVDEFGSVVGLVTPYDVMEAVVGGLPTEQEPEDAMAVQRDDGSWLIDGMMPLDELKDLLDVASLPGEDPGSYTTIAGYVVAQFGHLPAAGEKFEASGWAFEVVDMDGRRIDKLLILAPTPQSLDVDDAP